MTTDSLLTLIALALSVASVGLSGWFSVRTQRLSHKLADEREARLEQQSAIKAAERVYEPLAQAAAELQSRIFNIVETGWVNLTTRYAGHDGYAEASTAFLFAHYFGWIEARRQAVLSSSGEGRRDENVQQLIDGVLKVLRRSQDDSDGFVFFTTEQRAIGELMCTWETLGDTGQRIPHVMGYAQFFDRFTNDEAFRKWFVPVDHGMARMSEGDHRRLAHIQHALVALIDELDPRRRYTAGYELEPIHIGDEAHEPGFDAGEISTSSTR
jgi:hypothetical protein